MKKYLNFETITYKELEKESEKIGLPLKTRTISKYVKLGYLSKPIRWGMRALFDKKKVLKEIEAYYHKRQRKGI